jgi:hypothetical protein
MAIIRLLLDTGMRRGELTALKVSDVDLQDATALVLGKGQRPRIVPFGRKSAQTLDRYFRVRSLHRQADSDALWLGRAGAMTDSGVYQVVRDRGLKAGLPGLFTHQFRHTFAHLWQVNGGNESDLMRLAGWRSEQAQQQDQGSDDRDQGLGREGPVGPGTARHPHTPFANVHATATPLHDSRGINRSSVLRGAGQGPLADQRHPEGCRTRPSIEQLATASPLGPPRGTARRRPSDRLTGLGVGPARVPGAVTSRQRKGKTAHYPCRRTV